MALLFETFRTLVDSHKTFILTTHVNPDGDGLGTECALAVFLKSIGKQAAIINPSPTPPPYLFLQEIFPIQLFEASAHKQMIENSEVILILDTNHPDRLASMKDSVLNSKAVKVCIDHHLEPADFADLYILDEPSAATGEIVYRLINFLNGRHIEPQVAVALYTAIMTDTGSFRYPRTDPEVHKIIAHLIQAGADPVKIHENVYNRSSLNRIQLLGKALYGMRTAHDGRVAYMVLTKEMFEETKTTEADSDEFVPYTLSLEGVQVGLLFSELSDCIKINFRSKGDIWINELAKEFGGNGHKNAAGAHVTLGDLQQVINKLLEHVEVYLL
ncbi:MAG: bifunctional oligoribonuclease/PAP phosphatase NrnA [Bacteroidota bacterium]